MRAQVKIPQNEWKVKLKKYLRTRTNTKEGKIGKRRESSLEGPTSARQKLRKQNGDYGGEESIIK